MATSRSGWIISLGLLGACIGPAVAGESDADLAFAESRMREARVSTDGRSLLEYFRELTISDVDRVRLSQQVRSLGDDSFEVREKASIELIGAGRRAVAFLRQALNDADPEIAQRATECLRKIPGAMGPDVRSAAAQVLAARKPPGSTKVLLAYLPSANDEAVEEAVMVALASLGLREGKLDPDLGAALTDKEPLRRIAAAFVLGKARGQERKGLTALLNDRDPRVRFQAASALVRSGDRSAMPGLLALLADGPMTIAWQVETILLQVAGELSPAAFLGDGNPESRKTCRAGWEQWWKSSGAKIDLGKVKWDSQGLLGLNLVCDCDSGAERNGCLWECGLDGKPRWKIENVHNPSDVQLLPGGRYLIAEFQGGQVTERDRQGKILWTRKINMPTACQRLPNGNTFIAGYGELLEVTPDGKTVYSHNNRGTIYRAQKLRNGHILYASGNGTIVEMETGGKTVHSIPISGGTGIWAGVEPLPNGRFLVALYSANKIIEIDLAGKMLWECSVQTPSSATRLENGRTLVSSMDAKMIVEIDRSGKTVWKQSTLGRPYLVRRH